MAADTFQGSAEGGQSHGGISLGASEVLEENGPLPGTWYKVPGTVKMKKKEAVRALYLYIYIYI